MRAECTSATNKINIKKSPRSESNISLRVFCTIQAGNDLIKHKTSLDRRRRLELSVNNDSLCRRHRFSVDMPISLSLISGLYLKLPLKILLCPPWGREDRAARREW